MPLPTHIFGPALRLLKTRVNAVAKVIAAILLVQASAHAEAVKASFDYDLTKGTTGWRTALSDYSLATTPAPSLKTSTSGSVGRALYLNVTEPNRGAFAFAYRSVKVQPGTVYRVELTADIRYTAKPLPKKRFAPLTLAFKMGAGAQAPSVRAQPNYRVTADFERETARDDYSPVTTLKSLPVTKPGAWSAASLATTGTTLWVQTGADGLAWISVGFTPSGAAESNVAISRLRGTLTPMSLQSNLSTTEAALAWAAPWLLQTSSNGTPWRDETSASSPFTVVEARAKDSWRLRPPSKINTDGVKYPDETTVLRWPSQSNWTKERLPQQVTYSFHPEGAVYYDISFPLSPLSPAHETAMREIFKEVEGLVNLTFTELKAGLGGSLQDAAAIDAGLAIMIRDTPPDLVPKADVVTNYGTIHIGRVSSNTFSGRGIRPSDNPLSSDIFLNTDNAWSPEPGDLSGLRTTMHHELGHALGLCHTFDSKKPLAQFKDGGNIISGPADSLPFTVMTYNLSGPWPGTFMPYDILALQELYGSGKCRETDTLYRFDSICGTLASSGTGATQQERIGSATLQTRMCLWDSAGNDTFDFSAVPESTKGYELTLRQGAYSKATGVALKDAPFTAIAFNCVIENLIGTNSTDSIEGNEANNEITGLKGNDSIDGGPGTDTAIYRGKRRDYVFSYDSRRALLTVRDKAANRDGTDSLVRVERLRFSDATLSVSDVIKTLGQK